LLRYCLRYSGMVPGAPIINGINFAFTFHMRWISITRSFYFILILILSLRRLLSQTSLPVLLLNQKWFPLLRLQVSGCSPFRIMWCS
jgi:hypothetical protein